MAKKVLCKELKNSKVLAENPAYHMFTGSEIIELTKKVAKYAIAENKGRLILWGGN